MSEETCFTRVIFRTYPAGDVLAILLDVPANHGFVICYQHLGQHGEGHYRHCIDGTRPATEAEYTPLLRELQQIGYRFTKIHKRRPIKQWPKSPPLPAGLIQGAGIPKGTRVCTFIACGCCGAYHRTDFQGDCREDRERYADVPDDGVLVEDAP